MIHANDPTGGDRFNIEINIKEDGYSCNYYIDKAILAAEVELEVLNETVDSIDRLKPDCDKLDYILAASSGALCGLIDIFLVGKPGESPVGEITDRWFVDRTTDFAKICGWSGNEQDSLNSAIRFLEKKFVIPYDQRGAGDTGSAIFDLNPRNHHFKSLGHNPTLLGLFFSILDQFTNQSHFISSGELLSLQDAVGKFSLQGNSVPGKLFCGFVNWLGHLISDISGSSGSQGRGMGIPSPFYAWTNDVIAIKRKLRISPSKFDENVNNLALDIYKESFDVRFQTAQAIPVFVNESIVRLIYSLRRLTHYLSTTAKNHWSYKELWGVCEPFSNPTIKRMLTVAHGTFCAMDLGDASIRSGMVAGTINVTEFFLRLNIVGVGRFTVSLYGETKRAIVIGKSKRESRFAKSEITIVEAYLQELKKLGYQRDDQYLASFVDDFIGGEDPVKAYNQSVKLAKMRNIQYKTKEEADAYFRGETMHKHTTKFEEARDNAKEHLKITNSTIKELGENAETLYKKLVELQDCFDRIRNLDDNQKLKYEEAKTLCIKWDRQVQEIEKNYNNAIKKAGRSGAAGITAGVALSTLGPSAAMGVATTFGVASTGTLISSLSGAAATNAALAWLGGGALSASGGGIAAGSVFLSLAGPIGWTIAGVAFLSSTLFLLKNQKEKRQLEDIFTHICNRDSRKYDLATIELKKRINDIQNCISGLNAAIERTKLYGDNYDLMSDSQKHDLFSSLNIFDLSTNLLTAPIEYLQPNLSLNDLEKYCEVSNKKMVENEKIIVVFLANLLYKINLEPKDKDLLLQTLKKNGKVLASFNLSKSDIKDSIMEEVDDLLRFKYLEKAFERGSKKVVCPCCGAVNDVDVDKETNYCQFCGSSLFDEHEDAGFEDEKNATTYDCTIDLDEDEPSKSRIKVESKGIEVETDNPVIINVEYNGTGNNGRDYSQKETAQTFDNPTVETRGTVSEKQPTKRRTWLWVLGWILIFPVPLTILMLRNEKLSMPIRIGIIVIAWAAYILIGLFGRPINTNHPPEAASDTLYNQMSSEYQSWVDDYPFSYDAD